MKTHRQLRQIPHRGGLFPGYLHRGNQLLDSLVTGLGQSGMVRTQGTTLQNMRQGTLLSVPQRPMACREGRFGRGVHRQSPGRKNTIQVRFCGLDPRTRADRRPTFGHSRTRAGDTGEKQNTKCAMPHYKLDQMQYLRRYHHGIECSNIAEAYPTWIYSDFIVKRKILIN